ncbi:MAG: hypothetical protein AB7N76_14695 [Planctomycetota bacterium]
MNAGRAGMTLGALSLALGLGAAPLLLAQDGPAPKKSQEALEARIARLVDDLGADQYAAREKAYQELIKIGAPALPALRKAKDAKDPEVRAAAAEAIAAIEKAGGREPQPQPQPGQPARPRGGAPEPERQAEPQIPGMPESDEEFFKELEQNLPKDMQSLMERLRKQGPGMRLLTPDDPMFKEFLQSFTDPRRLEKLFQFGQGEQEERSGPGFRQRTFRFNSPGFPGAGLRLGLQIGLPPSVLRAQLDLPADQGLVVERLGAGSFAATQGVQLYDVLLSLDGQPLRSIVDLERLAKGGKLELLRKAKRVTLTLAPAPQGEAPRATTPRAPRRAPAPADKEKTRDF